MVTDTERKAREVERWLVGFTWQSSYFRSRVSCYIDDRIIGSVDEDSGEWYWLLVSSTGGPFDSEAEAQADFEREWLSQ